MSLACKCIVRMIDLGREIILLSAFRVKLGTP